MMKENTESTRRVSIADIIIKGEFRKLDKDVVASLADSIEDVGLMHPPTVYIKKSEDKGEQIYLVAGQHRVAAAKKLGWTQLEVSVVKRIKAKNRKRQITENLHRKSLTKREEGKLILEWIELNAKEGGHHAPLQAHDKGIKRAAKKFGKSPKAVRTRVKAASLHPDAVEALKKAGLDDNGSVIEEVAKVDREEQGSRVTDIVEERLKAAKIKKKKKAEESAPPTQPEDDIGEWSATSFDKLELAWEDSELQEAWQEANADDRQQFIDEVLCADEYEDETFE